MGLFLFVNLIPSVPGWARLSENTDSYSHQVQTSNQYMKCPLTQTNCRKKMNKVNRVKWKSAVLDVISVGFFFLFIALHRGSFLRRVLGGVFALPGLLLCGRWLWFSWGLLGRRRGGLCAVDRCEHYGRLQGTENKSLHESAEGRQAEH